MSGSGSPSGYTTIAAPADASSTPKYSRASIPLPPRPCHANTTGCAVFGSYPGGTTTM
jgi:hypothetical protein